MHRDLRIALMISVGLHVFFMSAVVIINPASGTKIKPYTRVDFLGPLLKKTAFDIMLETANPVVRTSYSRLLLSPAPERLKAAPPEIRVPVEDRSRYYLDGWLQASVRDLLTEPKSVPGFLLRTDSYLDIPWDRHGGRRLIYKPDPPVLTRGLYGDAEQFRIKLRVLVSAEGTVVSSEPVVMSSHPQLDIIASRFVRTWIFEPRAAAGNEDEWEEAEVILRAGE